MDTTTMCMQLTEQMQHCIDFMDKTNMHTQQYGSSFTLEYRKAITYNASTFAQLVSTYDTVCRPKATTTANKIIYKWWM